MCLSCKNNKSKNNYSSRDVNGKKVEVKRVDKPLCAEEVRKFMITKKKPVQHNYTYLYSENYQTIDKLLNTCNCGLSLQLNEDQIEEDMKKYKKFSEKMESLGKENAENRVEGNENLEKRSHKRFIQKGIRG